MRLQLAIAFCRWDDMHLNCFNCSECECSATAAAANYVRHSRSPSDGDGQPTWIQTNPVWIECYAFLPLWMNLFHKLCNWAFIYIKLIYITVDQRRRRCCRFSVALQFYFIWFVLFNGRNKIRESIVERVDSFPDKPIPYAIQRNNNNNNNETHTASSLWIPQ